MAFNTNRLMGLVKVLNLTGILLTESHLGTFEKLKIIEILIGRFIERKIIFGFIGLFGSEVCAKYRALKLVHMAE